MSTAEAQRRLLEALAAFDQTPAGLPGMQIAMPQAIEIAEATGGTEMANVWRALDALMTAVHNDRTGARR